MVKAYEKLKSIETVIANALGADAAGADARFEAGEILREYAGISPHICGDAEISAEAERLIDSAVERRLDGEPLQYIFGKWEFYGLPFYVGKGVLIPRPETELLAELAIKSLTIRKGNGVMLDLCSGTGCIPIAVGKHVKARIYAVELYPEAFSYLERNIELNKSAVTAINADALDGDILPDTRFDVITANPPYLDDGEMGALQREVRFEPESALYGGRDGLDFYRRLIPLWADRLSDNGVFAVETGEKQGAAVSDIMRKAGLSPRVIKDLGGYDRVVTGLRSEG